MEDTLMALVAVLAPRCAAQARPIENPGPHKMRVAQSTCQNWMDADELFITYSQKDVTRRAYIWETLGRPEVDARERMCVMIPAGAAVTVQKRLLGYECVTIKDRPASYCFYTRAISGTPTTKMPTYDEGTVFFVD